MNLRSILHTQQKQAADTLKDFPFAFTRPLAEDILIHLGVLPQSSAKVLKREKSH